MIDLINPHIFDLSPYVTGKPIEELKRENNIDRVVKLASNENPFPLPGHVSDAIRDEISSINYYPDTDSYYLKNRIAEYNGVAYKNVTVGAGLVEVIRMIIHTFLKPGEKVLSSEKTFLFYKIAAIEKEGKGAFVEAKMDDDYTFNLKNINQLIDDQIKIIFLTNPNNPTGTVLQKERMIDFLNQVPEDKIIVLDNAYHEYVKNPDEYLDGIDLAVNRKNVIVLRTFSKIYALAGLRVGYAISNESIISFLDRVKAPFNVTRVAQRAALASLKNDDFKNSSARLNLKNKQKLFNQLKEMDVRVFPSETNFLFFIPKANVEELNAGLLKEGVIVRPLEPYGVPEGIRVTVGFEEDNDFFVKKLKEVLTGLK